MRILSFKPNAPNLQISNSVFLCDLTVLSLNEVNVSLSILTELVNTVNELDFSKDQPASSLNQVVNFFASNDYRNSDRRIDQLDANLEQEFEKWLETNSGNESDFLKEKYPTMYAVYRSFDIDWPVYTSDEGLLYNTQPLADRLSFYLQKPVIASQKA